MVRFGDGNTHAKGTKLQGIGKDLGGLHMLVCVSPAVFSRVNRKTSNYS